MTGVDVLHGKSSGGFDTKAGYVLSTSPSVTYSCKAYLTSTQKADLETRLVCSVTKSSSHTIRPPNPSYRRTVPDEAARQKPAAPTHPRHAKGHTRPGNQIYLAAIRNLLVATLRHTGESRMSESGQTLETYVLEAHETSRVQSNCHSFPVFMVDSISNPLDHLATWGT
jgi:hypothetical protein